MEQLREEQQRKEDAELEQELALEKSQRRQPLADLSKKTSGNSFSSVSQSILLFF